MGLSPFMPPAGGPLIQQQDPELMVGLDPQMLIRMLTDMEPSFAPKYPAGYKKDKWKKPKPEQIWADARSEQRRNTDRISAMMETIRYLRFDTSGVFPRDQDARSNKDQDSYVSSDLVDDWQLLSAILASFDMSFVKTILTRANQVSGQTMEDFAMFMREEEIYRWANTGDMPLQMAEAKVLTSYGQIISRHLCNMDDEDYPFTDTLVDPASCYPVYGGTSGLKKMYRIMRMTSAQAYEEWGEPTKSDMEKIRNKNGNDDDNSIITVCEYADKRWRAAIAEGGMELLKVVEHDYGFNPFIVQGGPGGEPLFTDTSRASSENRTGDVWWKSGPADDWGLKHKLSSSIHLQKPRHDQLEAVMSRITTAIQDSNNPALLIQRDIMGSGTPLPEFDWRPGAVNEIPLGDQVTPMPTNVPQMDFGAFMAQINADKMTGSIPLGMYGNQQGSQQTGNSMSVASESGMDHITPYVQVMETYQTRKVEQKMLMWRNKGHLTRFQEGDEQMFMVPVTKPSTNAELARTITPAVIDAVGPRVAVKMTRLRIQELLQLANVAGTLVPLGMPRRRLFEKMGEHDYDRLRAEWLEEAEWDAVQQDPEMIKVVKVPLRIHQMMKEAINPEERAMAAALLDFYMNRMDMEQQAAMMPQGGGMMPGGGQPPGLPPGGAPPMGGSPMMPGSNTMNFAADPTTAPGAQGGQVGRPPGGGPFAPPM